MLWPLLAQSSAVPSPQSIVLSGTFTDGLLFCTTLIYDISRVLLIKIPISNSRRKFLKKSLDISSLVMATALSARSMYEARFVQIEKVLFSGKYLGYDLILSTKHRYNCLY